MDTFRTVLLIVAVLVGLYLFVSYSRRADRRAELLEPATRGDIRELSRNIGALETAVSGVSSNVSDIQNELGNLDSSVTVIQEELEALRRDASDAGSDVRRRAGRPRRHPQRPRRCAPPPQSDRPSAMDPRVSRSWTQDTPEPDAGTRVLVRRRRRRRKFKR